VTRCRGWRTLVFLGLAAAAPAARAQEVSVPVRVQVPLLLRIMTFDRNLPARSSGDLRIAVLYQSRNRTSQVIADEVARAIGSTPGAEAVGIDLDNIADLRTVLVQSRARVLYVSPLRGIDIGSIVRVSRETGVTTITGVPRYVDEGIAIGLDLKADRPEIIVNLEGARAEGADFTAQLLKLARVVQGSRTP
jgi:hypothetical protein